VIKVVGNKGIVEVITIFCIVLFAGMLISIEAVRTSSVSIMYTTLLSPRFAALSYVMDATLVLIMALLVLRRHSHHGNTVLFESLEGIVVFFTSFFVFLLLFAILMPQCVTGGLIYVYSAVMALALVLMKDEYHKLRDLATVISSVGVGLVLGLNFAFGYTMLILAAVAIYDYIGVFKTNEMTSLAKAFSANDLSFLMSVSDLEAVPRWGLSEKDIESYMNYLANTHELNDPRFKKILRKGELPVICQISLGEGDLSLPLMVAISAYFSSFGHALGIAVVLGAIVGIVATMLILKKYKHPIPAVPPLFACIGLFVGAYFILMKSVSLYYLGSIFITASALVILVDIVTITSRMHRSRMQAQEHSGAAAGS
jgi:presenilin-like A22 family membrane protease